MASREPELVAHGRAVEHVEQSASSPQYRPVRGALWGGSPMDVLHRCCAGLDVHKRTVVATVRRVDPAGRVEVRTETLLTMTRDLLALADWLAARGVTIAAMEST